MKKLPKQTLEVISLKEFEPDEIERFWSYVKGTEVGFFPHLEVNKQIHVMYAAYEQWWQHEQDLELVQKLKEVMGRV